MFGDKTPEVEMWVAQAAGVEASMVSKLLPMLAPMVLGWLGKKVTSGGLYSSGLGGLIQGEKEQAESSMPDLGGLPGGILGGGGDMLSSGMDALSGGDAATKKSGGGILDMLKGLFGGKR